MTDLAMRNEIRNMNDLACPETFQWESRRHNSSYFTPAKFSGIFETRRTIRNRRNAQKGWELFPSRDPHVMFDGRPHLYWDVVARNIYRARRRTSRSEFAQGDMNMYPITSDGGAILHVPFDDEDDPALPSGAPALRPPFWVL